MSVEHDCDVCDDPGPAGRIADALADLADVLTGFRTMLEREEQRLAAERAEEQDEKDRRTPARWHAAVNTLRDALSEAIYEASQPGRVAPDEGTLATQLAVILDKRLRAGGAWEIRDALQTLATGPPPDESLRDVALRRARTQLGTVTDDATVQAWADTWLAGALYTEKG